MFLFRGYTCCHRNQKFFGCPFTDSCIQVTGNVGRIEGAKWRLDWHTTGQHVSPIINIGVASDTTTHEGYVFSSF